MESIGWCLKLFIFLTLSAFCTREISRRASFSRCISHRVTFRIPMGVVFRVLFTVMIFTGLVHFLHKRFRFLNTLSFFQYASSPRRVYWLALSAQNGRFFHLRSSLADWFGCRTRYEDFMAITQLSRVWWVWIIEKKKIHLISLTDGQIRWPRLSRTARLRRHLLYRCHLTNDAKIEEFCQYLFITANITEDNCWTP